jgi:hypothetical protein
MGWEEDLFALLDDLEGRAEALYDAERDPELADRSRAAYQEVTLASRLMASVGREVTVEIRGVGAVSGVVDRVAVGWCLVGGSGAAPDWLVPVAALARVSGASERSVPEVAWSPLTRLSLGSALRRLAGSGERCVVHRVDGARHDGILRRVGQDFVEVLDAADRRSLVPFAALAAVQSTRSGRDAP